jgi:hypothetical protein
MPQILFDSPAIERAIQISGIERIEDPPHIPRKNSLLEWEPTAFIADDDKYMFQVQDISEYDADGKIKTPKVQVIDGRSPNSGNSGWINQNAFPSKSFSLEYGETSYLYAIAGFRQSTDIVLLKQSSVTSNVFIVQLIASVTVSDSGSVSIRQMIKPLQDFTVPLYQDIRGDVRLNASYTVSDKKISFSANVSGFFQHNTDGVVIPTTELRDDKDTLYVGTSAIEYPVNTEFEYSIVFNGEAPDNVRYSYEIISYIKESDDYSATFTVKNINGDLHILTFTRMYVPTEGEITQ